MPRCRSVIYPVYIPRTRSVDPHPHPNNNNINTRRRRRRAGRDPARGLPFHRLLAHAAVGPRGPAGGRVSAFFGGGRVCVCTSSFANACKARVQSSVATPRRLKTTNAPTCATQNTQHGPERGRRAGWALGLLPSSPPGGCVRACVCHIHFGAVVLLVFRVILCVLGCFARVRVSPPYLLR